MAAETQYYTGPQLYFEGPNGSDLLKSLSHQMTDEEAEAYYKKFPEKRGAGVYGTGYLDPKSTWVNPFSDTAGQDQPGISPELQSLLNPTPATTPAATPPASPVAPAASPTAPTVAPMAQAPQQQSQTPTPMPQPSVLSSLPGSLSPSTSYAMSGISQGMRPKKRRPMFQPYGGSGGVTGLPGL